MMMIFLKKNLHKAAIVGYSIFTPFAILSACDPGSQICNPITENSLSGLIKTLLEGALKIGFPVIALAIVYCGFLFVQARGKPEDLTKAKDALLYTLIGAAILLGSWAIAELIQTTVTQL